MHEFPDYPAWKSERSMDKVKCIRAVDLRRPLFSDRHIRLLKLYPAGEHNHLSAGLRCDIYQASLDDLSTRGRALFSALSYVWGNPAKPRSIQCGKRRIGITQNLYDALVHVRFADRPRLIWVDSLCINQVDNGEKSHQVGIMHNIYAEAHVVAWLGLGDGIDDIASLPDAVRHLAVKYREWTAMNGDIPPSATVVMTPAVDRYSRYLWRSALALKTLPLTSLTSLFDVDYFKRIWTIQEVAVAKNYVCQLGLHQVVAADMYRALQALIILWFALYGAIQPVDRGYDILSNALDYLEYSSSRHKGGRISRLRFYEDFPHTIVSDHRNKQCQDPRDHVYGLVALFGGPDGYLVDYSHETATVFTNFTIHCMLRTQSLQVLTYRTHAKDNKRRPKTERCLDIQYASPNWKAGLPSWCPDWADDPSLASRLYVNAEFSSGGLRKRAGGDYDACKGEASGLIQRRHQILTLSGIEVTQIARCEGKLGAFYPWNSVQAPRRSASLEDFLCKICSKVRLQRRREICYSFMDVATLGFEDFEEPKGYDFLSNVPPEDQLRKAAELYAPLFLSHTMRRLFAAARFENRLPVPQVHSGKPEHQMDKWVVDMLNIANRRLFMTAAGQLGCGPPGMHVGDRICVLYGGATPFVLRPVGGEGRYMLIGECYVDGLMYGEGMEMGLQERRFDLV